MRTQDLHHALIGFRSCPVLLQLEEGLEGRDRNGAGLDGRDPSSGCELLWRDRRTRQPECRSRILPSACPVSETSRILPSTVLRGRTSCGASPPPPCGRQD